MFLWKNLDETILPHQRITENRDKKHFNLLVPGNILSFKCRSKWEFNSKNVNYIDSNILDVTNVSE